MKKLLTLLFILTYLTCKSQSQTTTTVWTPEYEQEINQAFDQQLAPLIADVAQRKSITVFMVGRLKTELPKGLASISNDSLKTLCAKLGAEYARTHRTDNLHMALTWTADTERGMRIGFLSSPFLKDKSETYRNKACDCYIKELKRVYPDTVRSPIPDTLSTRIMKGCTSGLGN
ncbi:MAG: hypothetical protein ACXVAU_01020 [Mucilaginibacter sp.]